jgi:hypothetical protein
MRFRRTNRMVSQTEGVLILELGSHGGRGIEDARDMLWYGEK